MATYEEIYGKRVKDFDSDPTLESSYEGQVWYDKSTGVLKSVVSFDSWFSSSNMSVNRRLGGGFGTTSAAITFGGFPGNITATEEYNGSGWGSGGALNNGNARFSGSVGTLTAGLRAGGLGSPTVYVNNTEEYDGSSWTSVTAMPVSRGAGSIGGIGTQTAAIIAVGGSGIPTSVDAASLKYDGTNWTAGGSMNTGRLYLAGFGTQTAGLYAGGYVTAAVANVETYDGTSWSETTDISTARYSLSSSNNSPQTSGVIAGGDAVPGRTNATESWDGSSWTTRSTMGSARSTGTGAGTTANSMMTAGGVTPSTSPAPAGDATTEEFTTSINTITAAAWASGGNLNSARFKMEMNGTQTATIAMGGGTMPSPPSSTTNSEYYDGSSWTNQTAMNNSRQRGGAGAFGTQTAAMSVAGVRNPPSPGNSVTDTEEWGGSSWTSGGAVPSGRYSACFFGIQTAAVFAGGTPGPSNTGSTDSAEYDGSSFSSGNSMSNARYNGTSGGTLTAGLAVMGTAGGSDTANCEEYDGTNYSAGGTSLIADQDLGGSGTQTDFSCFIGPTGQTLQYDGTTWRTSATSATALGNTAGTGATANTAIAASGNPGTGTTVEFTGETETVTASTLTTS